MRAVGWFFDGCGDVGERKFQFLKEKKLVNVNIYLREILSRFSDLPRRDGNWHI
jgi:hypothetical protein